MTNPIGMNFNTTKFVKVRFGAVSISNVLDGIAYDQGTSSGGFSSDSMFINSITFANIGMRAIQALEYGKIVITHLRTAGTLATLYAIADTGRVLVGREELPTAPTTKWGLNPPGIYSTGWQQFVGNAPFAVELSNYGVRMHGLLQPVSGGTGHVVSMPPYLAPVMGIRLLAYAKGTSGDHALNAGVGGSSYLDINDGASAGGGQKTIFR